jgi:hypothetical protein
MPGDYVERFTGRGVDSELVCEACAASSGPTHEADDAAIARVRDYRRRRFDGEPEVIELASELWFAHEAIELEVPELADLRALGGDDRDRWLGVTRDGVLVEIDLDRREIRERGRVAVPAPFELHVSASGDFAAVVEAPIRFETPGIHGEIVELATDRRIPLLREENDSDVGRFPFAFITHRDRDVAIYAPEWNRLAAFDVRSGEALTARPTPAHGDRHYVDYYHCGLHVSPRGTMIADNGWVWQPVGIVTTWSIARWLDENAWESEDGRSRQELSWRENWDIPVCWIDETRLAITGHDDIERAVEIHDTRTGTLERWFAGPSGDFVFDRVMFALGDDTAVFDVERGGRLHRDPHATARYHAHAKCFATLPKDGRVTISRLRGLDAHAPWATDTVRALAASITDVEAGLPVLGDALDDAGCTDAEMLAHCRKPGPHGTACWVLDRLARR